MDKNELVKAATEVRHHAHAPYSRFSVGAALRTKSGRVFTGCNVESISLGLTMCAEQGAISRGYRRRRDGVRVGRSRDRLGGASASVRQVPAAAGRI